MKSPNNVPASIVTRNMSDFTPETGNVYESIAIISKRANQLQSCMDSVRKDGFLAVFLEGEEPYGNEED